MSGHPWRVCLEIEVLDWVSSHLTLLSCAKFWLPKSLHWVTPPRGDFPSVLKTPMFANLVGELQFLAMTFCFFWVRNRILLLYIWGPFVLLRHEISAHFSCPFLIFGGNFSSLIHPSPSIQLLQVPGPLLGVGLHHWKTSVQKGRKVWLG
jgi:hypothetical protein